MNIAPWGAVALLLASAGALSGCDDYGYGGPAVGYGPGYYDGYADIGPYYGGYPSYYGWYGSYYYPGTGFYVYDQYRRPFRWNRDQRRYWSGQRDAFHRGGGGFRGDGRPGFNRPAGRPGANWGGFNRGPGGSAGGTPGGRGFGPGAGSHGGHHR